MTPWRRSRLAVNSWVTFRLPPVVMMASRSPSSRLWSTKCLRQLAHRDPAKRMRVQVVEHQNEQAALARAGIGRDVGRHRARPAGARPRSGCPPSRTWRSSAAGRLRRPAGRPRQIADETAVVVDDAHVQLHRVDVRAEVGGCCAASAAPQAPTASRATRGRADRLHGADYNGEGGAQASSFLLLVVTR